MKAKQIQIADDDATLVRILEVRMRNLGFDAQASHDAMHALMLVHKNLSDLVVIEDVMFAGDGSTVCQRIESDRRLRHMPMILLTHQSEPHMMDCCRELGAYLIIKTLNIWESLKMTIKKILGCDKQCAEICYVS